MHFVAGGSGIISGPKIVYKLLAQGRLLLAVNRGDLLINCLTPLLSELEAEVKYYAEVLWSGMGYNYVLSCSPINFRISCKTFTSGLVIY